jgi:hypothetical protein
LPPVSLPPGFIIAQQVYSQLFRIPQANTSMAECPSFAGVFAVGNENKYEFGK